MLTLFKWLVGVNTFVLGIMSLRQMGVIPWGPAILPSSSVSLGTGSFLFLVLFFILDRLAELERKK